MKDEGKEEARRQELYSFASDHPIPGGTALATSAENIPSPRFRQHP